MTIVRDVLQSKSTKGVISIAPTAPITKAIHMLCHHNVGALVVVDEQNDPVGFISDRDILHHALHCGIDQIDKMTVAEAMNRNIMIGQPENDISFVSSVMLKRGLRHLPVFHENKMIGVISMGDVFFSQILDEQFENKMLHNYIEGKYPG